MEKFKFECGMCDEKYPCKVELPKGLKDTKLRCIFGFSHCYWKAIESTEPECTTTLKDGQVICNCCGTVLDITSRPPDGILGG